MAEGAVYSIEPSLDDPRCIFSALVENRFRSVARPALQFSTCGITLIVEPIPLLAQIKLSLESLIINFFFFLVRRFPRVSYWRRNDDTKYNHTWHDELDTRWVFSYFVSILNSTEEDPEKMSDSQVFLCHSRKHQLTVPRWKPVVAVVWAAAQRHGCVPSAAGASHHQHGALLPLQEKIRLVLLLGNLLVLFNPYRYRACMKYFFSDSEKQ